MYWVKSVIKKLHLITIHVKDTKSGDATFETVQTLFFYVLDEEWSTKMILVVLDGVRCLKSKFQGTMTRFENLCLRELSSIKSAALQLNLVNQVLVLNVMKKEFPWPPLLHSFAVNFP